MYIQRNYNNAQKGRGLSRKFWSGDKFGPGPKFYEKIGPPGPIYFDKNGPGMVRLDLHVCHVHLFVRWKTKSERRSSAGGQ